jgi:hypothetical protein
MHRQAYKSRPRQDESPTLLLVPHVLAAPLVGLLTDRARRPRRVVAVATPGFGGALVAIPPLLGNAPLWTATAADAKITAAAAGTGLIAGTSSAARTLVVAACPTLAGAIGLLGLRVHVGTPRWTATRGRDLLS